MKQKILSLLLFLFITFTLISEPIGNILNRSDEEYPLSNSVSREDESYQLALLPNLPASKSIIERFNDYHPELTVERLYRIDLPSKYSSVSPESMRILFTDIVNILGKPETQVGYTYHSSRKDDDVALFEELYISNKKGKQISGFVYSLYTLPKDFSFYQYVDEANFPGVVFEQNIMVDDDFLSYQSTNIETIRLFIFPVAKKKGTRNEVLFFKSGNYLYIYNCTQLFKEPALSSLGFSVNMSSMFRKRMDVMAEWLEDQLVLVNK
ncbi:MAG: hypothetical protein PF693_02210 [Spirochaetia bacterium]|jgi:hypothetical protein|nr:hypothetical protein [Spirochaetia bacterium]